MNGFTQHFPIVIAGIMKMFGYLAVGFILVQCGAVKMRILRFLSIALIWACMPCLIFTKIVGTFNTQDFPHWWLLPCAAILLIALGLALGFLVKKTDSQWDVQREFMVSCAFQNSGYLPMSLIAFTCSGVYCERLLVSVFLFLFGFNLCLWFFVPLFLGKRTFKHFHYTSFLNLPLMATISAFVSVLFFGRGWLSDIVSLPMGRIGSVSFPLSLLLVGMSLAMHKGYKVLQKKTLLLLLAIKLIVMPAIVLGIIYFFLGGYQDRLILFLEASMPVAVTLVMIGEYNGADNGFLSGAIFYSHVLSIVTIPAWLFVYDILL